MSEPSQQTVYFEDLGRVGYEAAWAYQTEVHRALVARKHGFGWERAPEPPAHRLLLVEHNPVYTLGKSGSIDHLLLGEEALAARGVAFHRINRGGDITFHGPGQVVGYPIFDLDWFFHDVRRYVWSLEEAVIRTLGHHGVTSTRYAGYTGVWLAPKPATAPGTPDRPWRKICAIGVHLSRWVTLHGFAFNVNTDLAYFGHIVPCGIADEDKSVTSLAVELGHEVDLAAVKLRLRGELAEVFGYIDTTAAAPVAEAPPPSSAA